jgi:putative transposase
MDTKYPYHRTRWRTTIWKASGIRLQDGALRLARARGLAPVSVPLPPQLLTPSLAAYREARLVWDQAARHSTWHLVIEDGVPPAPPPPGDHTAAIDLGEIHPATATDGNETVVFTCRALRSHQQYTAKRVARLKSKQDHKHQGSRRWQRLQRRKSRFRATQRRRARDLEHKVSRAVVDWASERQVHTLVLGDVRDVANGKRLSATSQQKIGVRCVVAWSAAPVSHLQSRGSGHHSAARRRGVYQPNLSGHVARRHRLPALLQPHGARRSLPGVRFHGPS